MTKILSLQVHEPGLCVSKVAIRRSSTERNLGESLGKGWLVNVSKG